MTANGLISDEYDEINNNFDKVNDALDATSPVSISAKNRNGIYRGKNLGTIASQSALETFLSEHSVTDETFNDLYLGDYFTISDGTYNKAWQIAGFDFAYNMGSMDTKARTVHHLAMFPRTQLTTSVMNETATTEGGYYNCYLRTTVLPEILTALQGVLGESHIIGYRDTVSTAVSTTAASAFVPSWTGCASSWSLIENTYIELMSMDLVYGNRYNLYDGSYFSKPLPIFNFVNWSQASNRCNAWLRDVASSTSFALKLRRRCGLHYLCR